MAINRKIVAEIEGLYKRYAITCPSEIDISAIAYCNGVTIEEKVLSSCEASIVGGNSKAIITVNSSSSTTRQRFSIGHELGHWFKDRGKLGALCKKSDMQSGANTIPHREIVANSYASELLMPAYLFEAQLKDIPFSFDSIRLLARDYKTSLAATLRRSVNANIHMGFIAQYDSTGTRNWFVSHKDLPYKFGPPQKAPANSICNEIVKNPSIEKGITEVDGDIWCKSDHADGASVWEHSLHYHKGNVLTLVWWEDEEPVWQCIEDDENN